MIDLTAKLLPFVSVFLLLEGCGVSDQLVDAIFKYSVRAFWPIRAYLNFVPITRIVQYEKLRYCTVVDINTCKQNVRFD